MSLFRPGDPGVSDPGAAPGDLDVLVLGSGVAGLSAAVRLAAPMSPEGGAFGIDAGGLRVGVLTKAELWQSATRWAQGGVAAVLGGRRRHPPRLRRGPGPGP